MRYAESEIGRIARVGFETARKRQRKLMLGRQGQRARHVAALARSRDRGGAGVSGRRAVAHVRRQRAMQLVRNPKQFDVIVTGNMFGDILSDEASMLAGLDRHAALGVARCARQGPVRADPRLGAGHRGQGPRQSARRRSCRLAMMLRYTFDAAPTSPSASRRRCARCWRDGHAHRGHRRRPARRAASARARDGRRGRSPRLWTQASRSASRGSTERMTCESDSSVGAGWWARC